ncbi:MAG TPA: Asp/Glu racemase [Rhizobiales bacterium]|nr:Asp/Glu racemase [Hyphomicrobiales bacterium]
MVVLQSDQTLENDFQRLLPTDKIIQHVTRLPSDREVTFETLSAMQQSLPQAVSLFPQAARFDVVGYGCTSGTSVIGQDNIAKLINAGCKTNAVTEPVSALIAACKKLDLKNIAFLSPYVEEVSATLRATLQQNGINTPVFGSFNEDQEEKVVRIDKASIFNAAVQLAEADEVEGIFLSCTNLKTLDVIADIEAAVNKPVLSSNQVLAWHLCALASVDLKAKGMGVLLA